MEQEQVITNQGTEEAGRCSGTQAHDLGRIKFDGWCEKCRWGINELKDDNWCAQCEEKKETNPTRFCSFKIDYKDLGPNQWTARQEMNYFTEQVRNAIDGLHIIAEGSEDRGTGYLISQIARSLAELETSMEHYSENMTCNQ